MQPVLGELSEDNETVIKCKHVKELLARAEHSNRHPDLCAMYALTTWIQVSSLLLHTYTHTLSLSPFLSFSLFLSPSLSLTLFRS